MVYLLRLIFDEVGKSSLFPDYCARVNLILTPIAVLDVGNEVETSGSLLVLSKNNLTLNLSFTA
jgi:hypothetical protein